MAVVPKLLGEIVRRLEPGPVTVVVTGDEAVIEAGRFTTSLRLKPAEDYPRLASTEGEGVTVDAAGVRRRRSARSCGPRRRTTCGRSSPGCCSRRTATVCAWSPPTRTGWRCATSRA